MCAIHAREAVGPYRLQFKVGSRRVKVRCCELRSIHSVAAGTGGVIGPQYASSKSALHGLIHWLSLRYCKEGIVSAAAIDDNSVDPTYDATVDQWSRSSVDRRCAPIIPTLNACQCSGPAMFGSSDNSHEDTEMMANPTDAARVGSFRLCSPSITG